MILDKLSTPTP